MAAPTLQAEGSLVAVTSGTLTVTLPAHQTDDILVCTVVIWSPDTVPDIDALPAVSGWTLEKEKTLVVAGLDGRAGFYWKRATSGSETDPGFAFGANWTTGATSCYAGRAYVIRGCNTQDNPWDEFDDSTPQTGVNPPFDALNVYATERMAVQFFYSTDNNATGSTASGWTAGTAADTTTGSDAGFQTFRQDNISAATSSGTSTAAAPGQGQHGFFGVSFRSYIVPVSLGSTVSSTDAQATYTHTTTAPVPAGAKIVVGVGWCENGVTGAINSITAGAISLTQDERAASANSFDTTAEIWSAEAPSGLASGSTITVDPANSNAFGFHINACYIEGIADTAYEDDQAVVLQHGAAETTAAWATGALDTTGEGVGIALAMADGTNGYVGSDGNTADLNMGSNVPDDWITILTYRRRASAGTVAMGGTFGSDPQFSTVVCAVAYKAAVAALEEKQSFLITRPRIMGRTARRG